MQRCNSSDGEPRDAYSVREFCYRHSISRALYYKLAKEGEAPAGFLVGGRRVISVEEAKQWRETKSKEAAAAKIPRRKAHGEPGSGA